MLMSFLMAALILFNAQASTLTLDEKRMQDFSSHMLKKSALDEQRQEKALEVKAKRVSREEAYELLRANFVRKPVERQSGAQEYERKVQLRQTQYEEIRDRYAENQRSSTERLGDKLDKVKMIEYGL